VDERHRQTERLKGKRVQESKIDRVHASALTLSREYILASSHCKMHFKESRRNKCHSEKKMGDQIRRSRCSKKRDRDYHE
jgi:hypothetical protein